MTEVSKDPSAPFKAVVATFSTAIVIGWAVGLVWMKVLDLMRGKVDWSLRCWQHVAGNGNGAVELET